MKASFGIHLIAQSPSSRVATPLTRRANHVPPLFLLALLTIGAGPDSKSGAAQETPPAADSKKIDYPCPEIARLEMFIGSWNVAERHFDSRGEVVATVKGTEVITWTLDHHWLRRTYTTLTESSRYQAIGMLSWNRVEKKYHGVWLDGASLSGPTLVKGEWDESTRTMVFTLESTGADGATVRHKVVEQFPDDERRVSTTYFVSGKDLFKRMEVFYKRSEPCPASNTVRTIGGPADE